MVAWNWFARMAAVPVCTAIVGCLVFLLPSIYAGVVPLGDALAVGVAFAAVGAVLGVILGCPLVLLLDDALWKITARYVVAGTLGGIIGWLLLEGAFAGGAWKAIWTNPDFWLQWAPRRLLVFAGIGAASGTLYTLMVHVIECLLPREGTRPGGK